MTYEEEYKTIKNEFIKKSEKIEEKYKTEDFNILNEGEYMLETKKLTQEFIKKFEELKKKYNKDTKK